ncbi:MAG: hypothetical protein SH850_08035 [Planctomycetaceae bacterium]|nr:hypothetical protein [Planctomycetaceae bacterium]
MLDMIGSLSLFSDAPEAEDTAPEIAEAVMSAVGDHDGAFLAEWKRRFRADAVGATADWKREVEPELIAKWMSEPTEPVI